MPRPVHAGAAAGAAAATAAPPSPLLQALSLEEWALLRAWAEGVSLGAAWARYRPDALADPAPSTQRRAALNALLARARAQAAQAGRPDLAALLRRDPLAMPLTPSGVPTLEAFREQQPPDFYSEGELLALYAQTHGTATRRARPDQRRARLRARLVEALQWLQAHAPVLRAPQPADPVGLWLPPPTARRLVQAGLSTLNDVHARMVRHGHRWPRGIARLGRVRADRLQSWWQSHTGTLPALPAQGLLPPAQRRRHATGAAIAQGGVAAPQPQWPLAAITRQKVAPTEQQALQHWLATHPGSANTLRAYRREGERLLLWCAMVRHCPPGALGADDAQAFLLWLAQPPSPWCAQRGTPRWASEWRPQEAGLGRSALRLARSALRAWFAHRIQSGLARLNPWLNVPLPEPLAPSAGVGRSNGLLHPASDPLVTGAATGATTASASDPAGAADTAPEKAHLGQNPHHHARHAALGEAALAGGFPQATPPDRIDHAATTAAAQPPRPTSDPAQASTATGLNSPIPGRHRPGWRPQDWFALRDWWSLRGQGLDHARMACLLALVARWGLRPAELARSQWITPGSPPRGAVATASGPVPGQPVAASGIRTEVNPQAACTTAPTAAGRDSADGSAHTAGLRSASAAGALQLNGLHRARHRWPGAGRSGRVHAHDGSTAVRIDARSLPAEVVRYATSAGLRTGDGLLQRLDGSGPIGAAQIYALLRQTVQAWRIEQRF